MKLGLIISGIILSAGVIGFFGINYYENSNNCDFKSVPTVPFIACTSSIKNFPFFNDHSGGWMIKKPLILLYPQKDTRVDVSLSYISGFSATFPEYDTTKQWWSVLAHPDGTLMDSGTNQDTYGLFWEGNSINSTVFDLSKWFIVQWSDIREFLYAKLTEIGLNTKEKSDFIMYWYPKLQEYPYIQITFAGKDYTNLAKLDISPKPDSLLRVFIVAKPLTELIQIPEQKLQKFERKGFSVVEWGGTVVE